MTERVRQTLQMVIPSPYAEPEYMGVDDDHGDCYASFLMVELREGEEIVASAELATLRAQLAGVREEASRNDTVACAAVEIVQDCRKALGLGVGASLTDAVTKLRAAAQDFRDEVCTHVSMRAGCEADLRRALDVIDAALDGAA